MIEKAYVEAEIVVSILDNYVKYHHPYAEEDIEMFHTPFNQSLVAYPFHNGRENGFVISSCGVDLYAFICEHRSSDSLTVTLSKRGPEWGFVTEEEYNNRKFFGSEEYAKVAHFVAKVLYKEWVKERKEIEKREKKKKVSA